MSPNNTSSMEPEAAFVVLNYRLLPSISFIAALSAIGFITFRTFFHRSTEKSSIPVVKSTLPWIGSAIDFVRAPVDFLKDCKARYGSVYKLHAAGRNIIVISSPKIISTLLRARSSDLDFVDYMYIPLLGGIDTTRMPGVFALFQQLYGYAARLLTPVRLHPIMKTYNTLTYQHMLRMTAADESAPRPLDDFIFRCNYFSVYGALIGEDFQRAKAYDYYRRFDDGVSNIIRKLPFLANAPIRARESMVDIVATHLKEKWEDNDESRGQLHGASELMSAVVHTLKNAEFKLTEDEIARMVNLTLWGSATNTVRLINWVIRYILVYPDLQRAIREEIQLATAKYPQISDILDMDPKSLDGPDFALLTSTIREVLRFLAQSVVLRQAVVDLDVLDDSGRDVHLSKGDFIFADTHSYHLSDDHFEDAQTFKPDRYMQGEPVSPSLAFSAGNHICPGRYLAMSTARMFAIIFFHTYDVEVSFQNGIVSAVEAEQNSFVQFTVPKYAANVILRQKDNL